MYFQHINREISILLNNGQISKQLFLFSRFALENNDTLPACASQHVNIRKHTEHAIVYIPRLGRPFLDIPQRDARLGTRSSGLVLN